MNALSQISLAVHTHTHTHTHPPTSLTVVLACKVHRLQHSHKIVLWEDTHTHPPSPCVSHFHWESRHPLLYCTVVTFSHLMQRQLCTFWCDEFEHFTEWYSWCNRQTDRRLTVDWSWHRVSLLLTHSPHFDVLTPLSHQKVAVESQLSQETFWLITFNNHFHKIERVMVCISDCWKWLTLKSNLGKKLSSVKGALERLVNSRQYGLFVLSRDSVTTALICLIVYSVINFPHCLMTV